MSQKLENLLNLALETPESVREQTEDLNVGYDSAGRTWELIVKYHGTLNDLSALGVTVEPLIAGYAVLTVPENLVEAVSALEEIEYAEKPKRYYYSTAPQGREAACPSVSDPGLFADGERVSAASSCVLPVTLRPPYLSGSGVLLAVLDSGIDFRRDDFRKADGTTRIRFLWDQTLRPSGPDRRPPEGFALGVEFDSAQIDAALSQDSPAASMQQVPSIDSDGHGTAVAGIAAAGSAAYKGIAPGCDLLIVKLGLPGELGFPQTTEIMRGVTYALRKALALNMPLVINLSFGNSYGAHDGSSLLERFLDSASEIGRTAICVGCGNEGNSAGHASGNVSERRSVELAVAGYERGLNIQFWKNYSDTYRLGIRSPGGVLRELPDTQKPEKFTLRLEQTDVLVYLGEPTPYTAAQEIYFELLPASGPYINSGVWQILIEPQKTVTGQYDLYLPCGAARGIGTGFLNPTPLVTLTVPSTASRVLTVGAYDSVYDAYADFSGRGYAGPSRAPGSSGSPVKPDLVAPGVDIPAPDLYCGYQTVTGTSFAAPAASGCAALLMEWGILQGNDIYLYGEKLKAFLRGGARPIRGEASYPNDRTGFGALCLADSFPASL